MQLVVNAEINLADAKISGYEPVFVVQQHSSMTALPQAAKLPSKTTRLILRS